MIGILSNGNILMGKFSLIITLLFILGCDKSSKSHIQVQDLRCEYRINPLGIDNINPRLGWKIIDNQKTRGQKQTAYQILVASSLKKLNKDKGDIWDSNKIDNAQSVNNLYAGQQLTSNQECYWKVRVWDMNGKASDWSKPARFTIGLLNPSDWKGEWILKADQKKTDHNWYRKNLELKSKTQSAFVYVGSFGYHELYVNGQKITDNVMNPVTSYMKKRIPYLTYDIKDYLTKGDNVIAIWHASGWARWRRIREYRNIPFVFKAQVEISTNGHQLSFGTDEAWKCKKSYSEYYGDWDILRFGGEIIDDRKREDDWNKASYDDSDWANASIYNKDVLNAKIPEGENISFALNSRKDKRVRAEYTDIKAELSSQMVEPQVRFKEIKPIGVKQKSENTYVIDMGENYTGFFEMNLYNGSEGDTVTFEIADQEGNVSTWNQKSQYIYGQSGKGHFTNRFNLAGGRWFTVSGLNYKPELKDIKGFVITNDRKQISSFESSSELLNEIYEVNLRTYLANTIDGILVDCPHRERRGWGEVTVAAMYGDALPNFESGAYMQQYAQLMQDTQTGDGKIRAVINEEDRPFLMWKANNPITIWETYRMLGDKKFLEDNYASMKKWMEWMYKNSDYETGGALKIGVRGKREMPGLGDWCTPRGNFWDSSNSPESAHFNNCVYAFMLDCSKKMAEVLGRIDDVKVYANRLKVQQKATHKLSYNAETGKYLDGRQVNQAFALLAGVTPIKEREKVMAQLADNVLYTFPYYDTGSSGQALYTRFFGEYGERMDLVYELLQDTRHPSYGYFLRQGKTVWPERWSAVGNSQIHTCYTGIGGYFIKGFGGIRPNKEKAGMKDFIVKPTPVGDLTFANTSLESMYGKITVNWKVEKDHATYQVEVPANCSAKVYIPAVSKDNVLEGGVSVENTHNIAYVGMERSEAVGNYIIYQVQSGVYKFSVNLLPKTQIPDPIYKGNNLSLIGRVSASSLYIETEKLPKFEAFRVNDKELSTSWKADGELPEWLEIAWVKPQSFASVVINENGNHIKGYKVQYWDGKSWVKLIEGDNIGKEKTHSFNAVTASKCRLLITKAEGSPSIAEFQILKANKL
ncbi:family 78 glycoside hydrolase catalytic domain [Flammeovirga sp. OC4]|uniref:family 78 glycoside hydrolase catalytic domain n=1 Tax=Flammeovirga sp. OC4 TaxID=1382345 RepID=UPI0009E42CD6|nr:family 78 glycoside hydrolase catalytic domain [Flammeovirga sp. OC4]